MLLSCPIETVRYRKILINDMPNRGALPGAKPFDLDE